MSAPSGHINRQVVAFAQPDCPGLSSCSKGQKPKPTVEVAIMFLTVNTADFLGVY